MEQPVVHHLENKQGRKRVDGEEEGFKGGGKRGMNKQGRGKKEKLVGGGKEKMSNREGVKKEERMMGERRKTEK